MGKGSWDGGVDTPPSPLPPRITALPPLPRCIPPTAPPLPVPLLYRRDTTRGREKNLPPWAQSGRGKEAPRNGASPAAKSV